MVGHIAQRGMVWDAMHLSDDASDFVDLVDGVIEHRCPFGQLREFLQFSGRFVNTQADFRRSLIELGFVLNGRFRRRQT